jgi:thioesterase domain-containing protein
MMDLSRFPTGQHMFMNRVYAACFDYLPRSYPGDVVVYEPSVTPIFYLPQAGSRWRKIAPRAEVIRVTGTHLKITREPHVEELAEELATRIRKHCASA